MNAHTPAMKMTIETKVPAFKADLAKLRRVLAEKSHLATRQNVADLARFSFNFACHIGGHHVAVHDQDRLGNIAGPRLAIVTSDGPDW